MTAGKELLRRLSSCAMQSYTNSGYWLLGRIVEKAGGVSYEAEIKVAASGEAARTRDRRARKGKLADIVPCPATGKWPIHSPR